MSADSSGGLRACYSGVGFREGSRQAADLFAVQFHGDFVDAVVVAPGGDLHCQRRRVAAGGKHAAGESKLKWTILSGASERPLRIVPVAALRARTDLKMDALWK